MHKLVVRKCGSIGITSGTVKVTNCLNKNLYENESLPHRGNLNEILPKIPTTGETKMRLKMNERKAVTKSLALRYQKASKNEKKVILDEVSHLTSYNRCYATVVFKQALTGKSAKPSLNRKINDRREARPKFMASRC